MKRLHIVFTTIHEPAIMPALVHNITRYGHLDDTKVWIVGDRKTPASVAEAAKGATAAGLETVYFDLDAQDLWGKSFAVYGLIPLDTDARRIFGFLRALEDGAQVLLSMDDDNFPKDDDLVGCHLQTGEPMRVPTVLDSPSGFHNICTDLLFMPPRSGIFPRGFPLQKRQEYWPAWRKAQPDARIGVTEGLWSADPDVDATAWLNGGALAYGYVGANQQTLQQSTWTPINSQNTSVCRELIPAFLFIPMGFRMGSLTLDRYGDIWGGYMLQALMQGTPWHVAFGRPLVEHRRNPHDYAADLRAEFWGLMLTDWLVDRLRRFRPTEKLLTERIKQLSRFLASTPRTSIPTWAPEEFHGVVMQTANFLRYWALDCRAIGE